MLCAAGCEWPWLESRCQGIQHACMGALAADSVPSPCWAARDHHCCARSSKEHVITHWQSNTVRTALRYTTCKHMPICTCHDTRRPACFFLFFERMYQITTTPSSLRMRAQLPTHQRHPLAASSAPNPAAKSMANLVTWSVIYAAGTTHLLDQICELTE